MNTRLGSCSSSMASPSRRASWPAPRPRPRQQPHNGAAQAVIKAQVLTGGRGKAGAIRVVSSEEQAESAAREILAMSVKGFPVQQVLVAERLDIRAEYYAGITIDREAKSVVLILSAAGGMDIEEIAAKEPQKIRRIRCRRSEARTPERPGPMALGDVRG